MSDQEQETAKAYTPATEEIRNGWARSFEFDRWLALHDREVAAKALEDAALDAASKEMTDGYGVSIWLRAGAAALRVQGETKP